MFGFGSNFGIFGAAASRSTYNASANLAGQTARRAAGEAAEAAAELAELEERFERLALACMGMWELLQERTDLTDEDLAERIREIDLRDGQADGRVTRTVQHCPKCDRTMSPRHNKCLYCGYEALETRPFDV